MGWQNSGKTTLVTRLINQIQSSGFSVSTIKHAHHRFDIDRPGKDSFKHREAGASEVLISSANRWALMHELKGDEEEPAVAELLKKLSPVDLVLIEGFKREPHPKLEVYRECIGKDPIWPNDPTIVAVASDQHISIGNRNVLDLNNTQSIAEFILNYVKLKTSHAKIYSEAK